MKPNQIHDSYKKALSDFFFCEYYMSKIAAATIEYHKKIIALYGEYKNDKKIKEIEQKAEWYDELSKNEC